MAQLLNEQVAVRQVIAAGSKATGSHWGTFLRLGADYRRALFIIANGNDLDADATVEVFAASDDIGTGATELTGITGGETFANGTDENRVGLIEVYESDLPADKPYVTVRLTTGATEAFAAVAILGQGRTLPAANAEANGVAFVASSQD